MFEPGREIEQYIEDHSDPEPDVLAALRRSTHLNMVRPRMLSGVMQGNLLRMFCRMIAAKSVLEIGTFTGYAAISMALGMERGGMLYTIESDEEREDFTREVIAESGVADRITLYIGDAIEIIPKMDHIFDLVFIDADKREYSDYYRAIIDKVRPGGIIVADDVLWEGKVVENTERRDAQTEGIMAFNRLVQEDKRVMNMILPIRHGLMIAVKL